MKQSYTGNLDQVWDGDLALDPRDGDADGVVDPDSWTQGDERLDLAVEGRFAGQQREHHVAALTHAHVG